MTTAILQSEFVRSLCVQMSTLKLSVKFFFRGFVVFHSCKTEYYKWLHLKSGSCPVGRKFGCSRFTSPR